MARVKILLADDHTLLCHLLRELLEPEYEVVGSVGDGRELLKAAATLDPDVVLVDIGMPGLNGLDAGRRLKQVNPRVKLIYLTMNSNVESTTQCAALQNVPRRAFMLGRFPEYVSRHSACIPHSRHAVSIFCANYQAILRRVTQ